MSPENEKSRVMAWIRWFLFSEGLILLLALAGPGYRYAFRRRGDHTLFARLIFEDPTWLQAVFVNFVIANIFVFGALFAAWIVTWMRKKR